MLDFSGRFQEILDIAEDFTRFAANPNATVVELNEFEGHLFLEVSPPFQLFFAVFCTKKENSNN